MERYFWNECVECYENKNEEAISKEYAIVFWFLITEFSARYTHFEKSEQIHCRSPCVGFFIRWVWNY